jgi:hypothetical protein
MEKKDFAIIALFALSVILFSLWRASNETLSACLVQADLAIQNGNEAVELGKYCVLKLNACVTALGG